MSKKMLLVVFAVLACLGLRVTPQTSHGLSVATPEVWADDDGGCC
jgi:hypothetical protein